MAASPGIGSVPLTAPQPPRVESGRAPFSANNDLQSWQARVFYGSQMLLALAVSATQIPRLEGSIAVLALFLAFNVAANFVQVPIYGESSISAGYVFTLAIIVLFGIPGVVVLAPIAAISQIVGRRAIDYRIVTHSARFILIYATAAFAYSFFGKAVPDQVSVAMVIGSVIATMVSFALSLGFLMVTNLLRTQQSMRESWERNRWLAPHYIALGVVGFSVAAAYMALGFMGVFAFVTPAVMMRFAMKQYVDKTTENVEKLERQNIALKNANTEIQLISDELETSYDGTLEALVNALDARDQETKGHSIRVSHYMMDIAKEMGVKEGSQTWVDMQRGSLLHDVGKIGITDNILLKPGKLTPEEWDRMRMHPKIGYNMLRQVPFLQGPAEIILSHHERWDGKGYPRGLSHDEIPFGARIFAVVDTFDSMTSDRPYRKALSTKIALDEILKYSSIQFDPRVVEAFMDVYELWVREREELHEIKLASAA
jgi:putative nucleotidyltransferase with HDIG domain